MRLTAISLAAASLLSTLAVGSACAAEIKVFSTNAMADVMKDLVPEFERTSGHKVSVTFEPTNAIMTRIKGGETADVIILIKQSIDQLKSDGKLVPNTDADLAKTSLGLAVRAGAPKP